MSLGLPRRVQLSVMLGEELEEIGNRAEHTEVCDLYSMGLGAKCTAVAGATPGVTC